MKTSSTLLSSLRVWIVVVALLALTVSTVTFAFSARHILETGVGASIADQANRLFLLYAFEMTGLFALLIAAAAVFMRFRVTRPLTGKFDALTNGSEKIAFHSTQVARDSGALADVTSKAAAGIEEIASTVEELASMTQRNADHSGETDRLMQETRTTVTQADASMRSLLEAIRAIQRQSATTSQIIGTIDEISFQTNILALNAAIEAARAGEHGASFAVVADEVRTLARRAAKAASDTSALIEETNRQVGLAATVVDETSQRFHDVNERVVKSSGYVSQIAQASAEQARGLDQLNAAISEIDKVVQQTVANAEHSASAAQQMSAESHLIGGVLGDLRDVLGVQIGAAGDVVETSQRLVLHVSVSSLVADSLAKWTRQTPVLQIDRFDSPFANRPTVDLVLQLQALAAGGLDYDYELFVQPNHGRALIELMQGYSDLTAETVWEAEIASSTDALLASTPVIQDGEFEKGLYILPANRQLLAARLPEQFSALVGATVFNWSVDLRLLENLGVKRIEKASKIENVFQLVSQGRADFTLLEFAGTPDMEIENNGVKLIPLPQCKISLPGSRSWVVSRQSPHATALVQALDRGIAAMRQEGRIERAFRESGFFNSRVSHWKNFSNSPVHLPRAAEPAVPAGTLRF